MIRAETATGATSMLPEVAFRVSFWSRSSVLEQANRVTKPSRLVSTPEVVPGGSGRPVFRCVRSSGVVVDPVAGAQFTHVQSQSLTPLITQVDDPDSVLFHCIW